MLDKYKGKYVKIAIDDYKIANKLFWIKGYLVDVTETKIVLKINSGELFFDIEQIKGVVHWDGE